MKMKNTKTILAICMVLAMAPMAFAYEFVFNTTNSSTTVNPPSITMSLYAFTTIYHLDNSTAGRNDQAPGYEYQYAGDIVHFTLVTQSNSMYVAEHMNVTVRMNCSTAGIQIAQTYPTSSAQYVNGQYRVQYAGDYTIPATISENCPIYVVMEYNNQTKNDYLTNSIYMNVNDLLMNPTLTLTENADLSFTLTYNAYATATPYPQLITLSTPVDREGEGILGNFTIYKTPLVGQTLPSYVISPANYRYAIGSSSAWSNLVMQGSNGHTNPIPFTTTTTPSVFNLYWQLYMDGNLPSQQYVGSGWYLINIL
jgi:hypothetical protein